MKIYASLTFDDGCRNYFTRFRPIVRKYNYQATFYVITDQIGLSNRMTWEQINTLYCEGHEIGSHTHTHPNLTSLPNSKLDFELKESKKKLANFKPTTLSYPFGNYNQRVINFTKKYYSAARACGDLLGFDKDLGFNSRGINLFCLKTVKLMPPKNLNHPKGDCWLIFVIHDPPKMTLDYAIWSFRKRRLELRDGISFFQNLVIHRGREENTADKLEKICLFLKKHSIKVVTVKDGIKIFGK